MIASNNEPIDTASSPQEEDLPTQTPINVSPGQPIPRNEPHPTDFQPTNDWDNTPSDLWDHPQAQEPRWLPPAKSNRTFPDVPAAIESLAVEAHDCLTIKADRAAVTLARAVVEASAKEKGVTKGSLIAKIDELHELGLLRAHIKEAAHEVRFGGNEAAHGDLKPVDHEAAEEILTLMDEVLNELFQSPARVARARQRRLKQSQVPPDSNKTPAPEASPSN